MQQGQIWDVRDIRKCISCNVGCVGNRIGGNKPLRCTVNPDLINGEAYKKQKVNKPCNVVVVGAAQPDWKLPAQLLKWAATSHFWKSRIM